MKKSLYIFLTVAVLVILSCKTEVKTVQGDYDPNLVDTFMIFYDNPKGENPKPTSLAMNAKIKEKHLPSVSCKYFNFDGWYLDDQKIEKGYVPVSDITLTARYTLEGYEYETFDVSDFQFKKPSRNDLSMEGRNCKVKLTKSGSGSWGFNYPEEYSKNDGVRGIEAEVKVGSKMSYAGFRFFPSGNYDDSHPQSCYDTYDFIITNDGKFQVKFNISGGKSSVLYNKTDGVKSGVFNKIKVLSKPNTDVEVYLNGILVYTIKSEDLKFIPDTTYILWNSKSCSSTEPGEAWYHYLSFQKVK